MQIFKKTLATITFLLLVILTLTPILAYGASQKENNWKFENSKDYETSKEALVSHGLAKLAGNQDAGKTWENVTKKSLTHGSQDAQVVQSLLFNSQNQNLYAFTNPFGDIFVSSDNGKTWNFKSSLWDTAYDTITKTLLLSNGNFLTLVRCSTCLETTYSDGILKSTDQGATWSKDVTFYNSTNPKTVTIANTLYAIDEVTDIFQAKNGKIYALAKAHENNGAITHSILLESTGNNSLTNFTGYLLDNNNDPNLVLSAASLTQHANSFFYLTVIKSDPNQTQLQILKSKETDPSKGFEVIKEVNQINSTKLIKSGADGHLYILGSSYNNGSLGVILRSDNSNPTSANNGFTAASYNTATVFTDLLNSANGRIFTTAEKEYALNKTNDGDVYYQDPANTWKTTDGKLIGSKDSTSLIQSPSSNYIFAGASLPVIEETPSGAEIYRTCETYSEGYVINKIGVDFTKIIKFEDQLGIQQAGIVKYQISPNGTDWYFYNGTKWTKTSQGSTEANSSQDVNKNISKFLEDLSQKQGKFFFKAFLIPTSSDRCANLELAQVKIVQETETPTSTTPRGETSTTPQPTAQPKILAKTGAHTALLSLSLIALGFITLSATSVYFSKK
jgi:hypothetical protein